MTDYAAFFRSTEAENTFFAGANTPHGFVSDYGSLLSEDSFSKVYIIKGGSGTGKSTLMRRCAASASGRDGVLCTLLLCGSDPDSLDGVLIETEDEKIAIIDGTAPHTLDPVYAGACGEIVNCGDYWNAAALEERKKEIAALTGEKKLLYMKTYRYLRAAAEMLSLQQKNASAYLLSEKLGGCVRRLIGEGRGSGRRILRRTQCISAKGALRLDSFERAADNIVAVKGFACISPVFFETLRSGLLSAGFDIAVSESPLFGTCEIFVPESATAYVGYCEGGKYDRVINLQRFADKDSLTDIRKRQRFAGKCLGSMLEGALSCLAEIGEKHFLLEDIYKPCMNFTGLDALGENLCDKIKARIG